LDAEGNPIECNNTANSSKYFEKRIISSGNTAKTGFSKLYIGKI
jgi:putative transposon-encoded protein